MLRTRDEYFTRPDAKKPEDQRPRLELLRQAAVRAELLTGHSHWDSFLGYIQAAVEETELQRESLISAISDPLLVDRDTIMRMKIALAECKARIEAWQVVIELPKDLVKAGDKAKGLLERLSKQKENGANAGIDGK